MGSAGGFRVGLIHPLESYIRQVYGFDQGELAKVAHFLLAHSLVDVRLISLAVAHEVRLQGGVGSLDHEQLRAISERASARTFSKHLEAAKATDHLPSDCESIAVALNKTRDDFLHWRPGRRDHPVYEGLNITTEAGFKGAMDAVLLFLQRMPFQLPD